LVHKGGRLIGLNAMGTRIRHLVVEGWIRDGRELDYVIAHLADAAFDPEFYRPLRADLVPRLQQQLQRVGSH
jgi:NADH oxidase (H2O2-forming)